MWFLDGLHDELKCVKFAFHIGYYLNPEYVGYSANMSAKSHKLIRYYLKYVH